MNPILGVKYIFIDVEIAPDKVESYTVYVCHNERSITLRCPCPYNEIITLSTLQNNKPRWEVQNYNTIQPSIQRTVGCKSHFSIINGTTQ